MGRAWVKEHQAVGPDDVEPHAPSLAAAGGQAEADTHEGAWNWTEE